MTIAIATETTHGQDPHSSRTVPAAVTALSLRDYRAHLQTVARRKPATINTILMAVVGVELRTVPGTRDQLIKNRWVHRRLVSGDLHRDDLCGGHRPGEETPGHLPSRVQLPARQAGWLRGGTLLGLT